MSTAVVGILSILVPLSETNNNFVLDECHDGSESEKISLVRLTISFVLKSIV